MKRGPKPKPTSLKKLQGNPGKRRLPKAGEEPEGVGSLWAAPEWFDAEQKVQWQYAIDHAPPSLLTGTDRDALIGWCVACVEYKRAVLHVRQHGQLMTTKVKRTKNKKTGRVIMSGGNVVQNPALGIMNRQAMLMLKYGGELGFSPAARTALGRAQGRELDPAPPAPGGTLGRAKRTGLAGFLDEAPDELGEDDGASKPH